MANEMVKQIYRLAARDLRHMHRDHGLLGWLGLKKTCGICGGAKLLEDILEKWEKKNESDTDSK